MLDTCPTFGTAPEQYTVDSWRLSTGHLQAPPMEQLINSASLPYIFLIVFYVLLLVITTTMFFAKNKMPVEGKVSEH